MIDRCLFVAVTTKDLERARGFWVGALGFRVTEEQKGHHFMLDAKGLRLCIDLEDGATHVAGGGDPVLGFHVRSLASALEGLARRGVKPEQRTTQGERGVYALLRDPDGHQVVLTEASS